MLLYWAINIWLLKRLYTFMNIAFKKGKLKSWYGSRFYKGCLSANISYSKYLLMHPLPMLKKILGNDKAKLLKETGKLPEPKYIGFKLSCVKFADAIDNIAKQPDQ